MTTDMTDMTATVVDALLEVAPDVDPATLDADALLREDLELDSMDILNLVVAINEATGIDVRRVGRRHSLSRAAQPALRDPARRPSTPTTDSSLRDGSRSMLIVRSKRSACVFIRPAACSSDRAACSIASACSRSSAPLCSRRSKAAS